MTAKYEMPALTDEQRKALLSRVAEFKERRSWSSDGLESLSDEDSELLMRIALATLTAEPVGYVSNVSREIANDGRMGYISNHMVAGLEGGYVYAAPPVPALKLPDDVPDLLNLSIDQQTEFNTGFWYGVEKVKRLNGINNG